MHVPVSRVEPFTRVYNWPNAKTDAAFKWEARWCAFATFIQERGFRPHRMRYRNQTNFELASAQIASQNGKPRICRRMARNRHINKGIPVSHRLPTYLAFNQQASETSRQPPSAHVEFSKR